MLKSVNLALAALAGLLTVIQSCWSTTTNQSVSPCNVCNLPLDDEKNACRVSTLPHVCDFDDALGDADRERILRVLEALPEVVEREIVISIVALHSLQLLHLNDSAVAWEDMLSASCEQQLLNLDPPESAQEAASDTHWLLSENIKLLRRRMLGSICQNNVLVVLITENITSIDSDRPLIHGPIVSVAMNPLLERWLGAGIVPKLEEAGKSCQAHTGDFANVPMILGVLKELVRRYELWEENIFPDCKPMPFWGFCLLFGSLAVTGFALCLDWCILRKNNNKARNVEENREQWRAGGYIGFVLMRGRTQSSGDM